jgi:hypothetical protein
MRQAVGKQLNIEITGFPCPSDRGNPDQLTTKRKEKEMLQNTLTVSGSIKAFTDKSIKTNEYGTSVIGWISQRDVARMSNGDASGNPRYIVGVGFKATDPAIVAELVSLDKSRQGQAESPTVTLTGRLTQWVAKSKTGGADEFRYQLEVHAIERN